MKKRRSMDVRAYLHEREEYFYPKSDSNVDLVEFYSVLEGYRLQGVQYSIDNFTGVLDSKNVPIYEKDSVRVKFLEAAPRLIEDPPIEVGWVEFDDGCFVITNSEGFIWELGGSFLEDQLFQLAVIGRHPKFKSYDNQ